MKQIIRYLHKHFSENKQVLSVVVWGCLLVGLMLGRYYFQWDIRFGEGISRLFLGFWWYALPLLATILLWTSDFQQRSHLAKSEFWVLVFLIVFVLWINQYGLVYHSLLGLFPEYSHMFVKKISFNLQISIFYLLIPWLYGKCYRPESFRHFYGVQAQGFRIAPYAWMLLIMLPLLLWASFREDFLLTYPRYRPGLLESTTDLPVWSTVVLYESTYVTQFIALEIFFRGFMVMALGKFLGSKAVFPMVTVYMLIHFYKPMPETLGSILGGYTLGVIAFYSRSVWGGVIVHIGIALLMELLAFWQLSA